MLNFIVLFLIVLVTACGTISADRTETAKQQVAEATAAWVEAYNSRDPARITSLYDPEAVFWETTAKTIAASPAAVAEYFKYAGKTPEARVTLGEQHIRVYGDVAINTGYYTLRNPARYTFVYRNRNGKWLIVDHHSSRVPG
jgi:uncharacterized protein (TIGR02246 family)